MKRNDIKNLWQKPVADLQKEVLVKQKELTSWKLGKFQRREKNTRSGRTLRSDIARLQSVVNVMKRKEGKQV